MEQITIQPISVTWAQLQAIVPNMPKGAEVFVGYLNQLMPLYGIDTAKRVAMFIAQLAHESEGFRYSKEIRGPTSQQLRYERNFKAAWPPTKQDETNHLAYMLGNVNAGDGKFFRGRAFIMCTGRSNYQAYGKHKSNPELYLKNPELLEAPANNIEYCCWFWQSHNLNASADKEDIEANTRIINGGLNGIDSRKAYYEKAKETFMIS